jgi:hypothetical protein
MREIGRKTILLIRTHPILWTPYIAAALLASTLSWLRQLAAHRILHWTPIRQVESVLGGNLSSRGFDPNTFMDLMRLRSALTWAVTFLINSVYAAALVFTAILVAAILLNERPILALSAGRLRGYSRRILIYAAKIWILMLVLYLALDWPFYLPGVRDLLSSRAISVLNIGISVLDALCYAWVMAPLAVNLLRLPGGVPLSIADRRRARSIAVLVGLADVLVRHILDWLVWSFGLYGSIANDIAYYSARLIAGLPYVLLYVALSLIADPELQLRAVPDDSTLLKWLRSLMPLHFEPRGEL